MDRDTDGQPILNGREGMERGIVRRIGCTENEGGMERARLRHGEKFESGMERDGERAGEGSGRGDAMARGDAGIKGYHGDLDAGLGLVGEADAEDGDGGGGSAQVDELPSLALALLGRLEVGEERGEGEVRR